MTLAEVKNRLEAIAATAGDAEVAHGIEDRLHQDVLEAIARGNTALPGALAREALRSREIEFPRYAA